MIGPQRVPASPEPAGPPSWEPRGGPGGLGGQALETLGRIAARLTASLDLQETLRAALDVVRETCAADVATIRIFEEASAELALAATAGLTEDEAGSLPQRSALEAEGVDAEAARTRAPVCLGPHDAVEPPASAAGRRLGLASVLCVPLLVPDRLVGTLLAGDRPGRAFGPDHVALAVAIAQVVGPALERAALYGEVERLYTGALQAKARADALAEIGRALASAVELRDVLELIVERTPAATESEACGIFRWDAARETFVPVAIRGLSERFRREFAAGRDEGISGLVLREGRPAWSADVLADPRLQYTPRGWDLVRSEGFRGLLAAPIHLKAEFFGTLITYRWRVHEFSEDEVQFHAALADQAAVAIEHARLFDRQREAAAGAERQRARAEALAAVGQAMSASLDLSEVLSVLVEQTAAATGADAVAVLEREPTSGVFRFRRAHGLSSRYLEVMVIPASAGIAGIVLALGHPHWTADVLADPRLSVPDEARALIAAEGIRGILSVPIRGKGPPYGVLNLYWRGLHPFDPEEIAFAARIADQAAIAIENAHLHGETVRKQEEAEALRALARLISSTLDADEIFRVLLEQTCQMLTVSRCAIWEAHQDGEEVQLRLFRSVGLNPETWQAFHLSMGEGTTGGCIARRAPVWTADLLNDPAIQVSEETRRRVAAEGYRAVCSAPILLPDGPFGALTVFRDDPHAFEAREVALLSAFADQAAIAIQNARLFQREQERRQQLEAVRAVTGEILRELDLTTLLALINRRAVELVRAAAGTVYLWDEAGAVLVPQAWSGPGEWMRQVRFRLGEGVTGLVAQRREGLIVKDYRSWPSALSLVLQKRPEVSAILAEPVLYRERLLGVITISHEGAARRFSAQDQATLALFANQAAIAIENARLYAETRKAYEDLQAAQEQLVRVEKLRALGEMAGGVAHDFNNLLAAILGQAQLLQLRSKDPQARQGLEVIERAALDGAETVRRILGFARVRPEEHHAPVELGALISEALEVTRPRWKDEVQGRGIVIEVELAVEAVPPVRGNAAELREVLLNLVFNAVDAMPQGGRLTVGARRLLRPARAGGALNPHLKALADEATETQELVEVFVRDTGVGMSEAVRRRAFEPFFTTKGVKGTGLGLSMAYGIVSRHGGELLIESREGAGTTVAFRLPACAQGATEAVRGALPSAAPAGRIVVVDDDEVVGGVLAEILRLKHHRVDAFTDPRRALEHLAREPADLLFTDLGMPELSGWEVARRARELRPDLPVVLVSGWGQQIDPAEVRKFRVNALVAKPYRVEDILRVVAELLGPAQGA